ncbi:hypothetical protein [Nereida sp. MMG025]|uniref:hypothetical protein n=1 Tax=Nereida sp. MMG025 TaxID=2909981 RepID=UPI001F47BEC8|nr:hypothetical protein [Nereida sp. MMG025]MCF6443772.1 hypothetical protein [Nereida sp. MMG025]
MPTTVSLPLANRQLRFTALETAARPWIFVILVALWVAATWQWLWADYADMAVNIKWRVGEWLINSESGRVRRGLMGDGLIWLADTTGLSLAFVVLAIKSSILALYAGLTALLVFKNGFSDRLAAMALLPLGLVFVEGVYKEMLVYVALAMLIVWRGRLLGLVAAWFAYAVALAGHEGLALLLPAILILLWWTHEGWVRSAAMLAFSVIALASGLYAVVFTNLSDISAMCAAVTDRGFPARVCDGAMWYTKVDETSAAMLLNAVYNQPRFYAFLAAGGAQWVVIYMVWRGAGPTVRQRLMIAAAVLAILPLFYLAFDYGRWMSMQVMVAFFALALLRTDRDAPPLPAVIFWPSVTLGAFVQVPVFL